MRGLRQNVFQCGFGDLNSNGALKQSGRRIILANFGVLTGFTVNLHGGRVNTYK
jgi:hypothetical protein